MLNTQNHVWHFQAHLYIHSTKHLSICLAPGSMSGTKEDTVVDKSIGHNLKGFTRE